MMRHHFVRKHPYQRWRVMVGVLLGLWSLLLVSKVGPWGLLLLACLWPIFYGMSHFMAEEARKEGHMTVEQRDGELYVWLRQPSLAQTLEGEKIIKARSQGNGLRFPAWILFGENQQNWVCIRPQEYRCNDRSLLTYEDWFLRIPQDQGKTVKAP